MQIYGGASEDPVWDSRVNTSTIKFRGDGEAGCAEVSFILYSTWRGGRG